LIVDGDEEDVRFVCGVERRAKDKEKQSEAGKRLHGVKIGA
jgi:hypothetical protein